MGSQVPNGDFLTGPAVSVHTHTAVLRALPLGQGWGPPRASSPVWLKSGLCAASLLSHCSPEVSPFWEWRA